MSKTKKTFMKAGGIIGIVGASLLILAGIMLLFSMEIINYDFIVETLAAEGILDQYTEEMIQMVLTITKAIYVVMAAFIIGLAVANLVLSIKVIRQANANVNKKGCIIALLVLSLLTGNLITFAFMITALCLNNKPAVPTTAGVDNPQQ